VAGGDARVGALVGAVPHGVGVCKRASVGRGWVAAVEVCRRRSDERGERSDESDATHVEKVGGDAGERWEVPC
jgi:hypothetical protein